LAPWRPSFASVGDTARRSACSRCAAARRVPCHHHIHPGREAEVSRRVEQVLCAKLHSGDVVVMDNLSAHRVAGIRQLIEDCGAQVPYLPPYSPDLNPIEKARPRHVLPKPWTKPLPRPAKPSPLTTPLHGSVPADTGIQLLWLCSRTGSLLSHQNLKKIFRDISIFRSNSLRFQRNKSILCGRVSAS